MTLSFPLRLVALLFALAAPCGVALAQGFAVQANPPELTPEAVLDARAQTARAGSYFLTLRATPGGAPLRQSTALAPDAEGRVAARLLVGTLAPGSYVLALSEASPSGGVQASAPVTVTNAISVKGVPDPGRPGAPMTLEASGLRLGTATVLVNGAVVAAALPVTSETFLIPITLPAGTPPGTATLEVRNFAGDQLIGLGRGGVGVQPPPFTGPGRVINLTGVPATFRVNRPFDIAGRVELARGSPQGMLARLRLRLAGGRTLLIDDGRGVVAANGDFRLRGRLPSLMNGAPLLLGAAGNGQGDVAIEFVEPEVGNGRRNASFSFPLGSRPLADPDGPPAEIGLNIQVRDLLGQPVPNAVVTLFGEGGASILPGGGAPGAARGGAGTGTTGSQPTLLYSSGNQVLDALQQVAPQLVQSIAFECPVSLFRNKTDAQGNLQIRFSPFALLLAQIEVLNADIADGSPDHDTNLPVDTQLRLRISPLGAGDPAGNGYTFADNPAIAAAGETYLTYDHPNERWCQGDGTGACNPIAGGTVPTLTYTVRPYTGQTELPISPVLPGLPKQEVETLVDRYGPVTTFPGTEFNDATGLGIAGSFKVGFTFDQQLFGILNEATLSYRPPGSAGFGAPVPFQPSVTQACANVDETEYELLVPGLHRFAWTQAGSTGRHRFRIDVRSGQRSNRYEFDLETQPPPAWWRNPPPDAAGRHVASWSPTKVDLRMDIDPAPVAIAADLSEIDMGTVNSRNASSEVWNGARGADGAESFKRTAANESRAANNDGTPQQASVPGLEAEVRIGPQTIINTGWVPLFRTAWGIPPIAAATFGIDAFFLAKMQFDAVTRLAADGGLDSSLTVTPTVEAAIKAFLNVSAILGFVDLTAAFTPSFALSMPVQVTDGASVDLDECFRFGMDVEYEVTVGWCPVCASASDSENLFTKRTPSGCVIPPGAAKSAAGPKLAALGITRFAPPSAAFDPLGGGSLVRLDETGGLEVRPWNGVQFGAAQVLAGRPVGASAVQHAYVAAGRAVMVYEKSNLSEAAFRAASLDAAAASRSIVARTLGPSGWSAEQPVSPPGNGGEGQVALATCPANRAGCPAGGEVLAVWIRNPDGQPFAYRYEVWHAFWRNDAWTAPARIADPGTGADMHPRAAYLGATPVVTFTRSSARSIDGQAQRRLMYRVLPSGAATEIAGTTGAQWQSLAVDGQGRLIVAYTAIPAGAALVGNQAVLWAARGTCTGTACSFEVSQQRDALGRSIRAESPSATRLADGSVRVAYRGLGFGPNAQGIRVAPGDSEGLITGLGEVAQLVPAFNSIALPQALTSNTLLNFNPLIVQAPGSTSLVVFADQASAAAAPAGVAEKVAGFKPAASGLKAVPVAGSLVQIALPDAPDFSIDELLPQFDSLAAGGTPVVDVALRNSGRRWVYDGRTALQLQAAWDAPPGVGIAAGSASVTSMPDSGQLLVRITLALPPDAAGDQRRSLHVRVNGNGAIDEADGGNNDAAAAIGGLPAPQSLAVVERRRDRHVLLRWQAPDDPRIKGFRIWRAPPPAPGAAPAWFPVGSTFTRAFVDLTGDDGASNWYRVTAYGDSGIESPPSAVAIAARDDTPTDLIFAASQESPRDIRVVVPAVP